MSCSRPAFILRDTHCRVSRSLPNCSPHPAAAAMALQEYRTLTRLSSLSSRCLDKRSIASLLAFNIARVSCLQRSSSGTHQVNSKFTPTTTSLAFRTYATDAVSRPKAHTGRTTTKKAPAAKATTSDAAPATKKPAAKKTKTATKSKSTSKSTSKAKAKSRTKAKSTKARKKPSKKTKTKAAPKKKKKVQTPEEKTRLAIKALKVKALSPPKKLPYTAFQLVMSEVQKAAKTAVVGEGARDASAKYRAFSPEEREHYNHTANQNKATNAAEFRKWIESYTPSQINLANNARMALRKRDGAKTWPKLQDERLVTTAKRNFILFYTERYKSGDFKGIPVQEAAKVIGGEWRALDAAEKRLYSQQAEEETARYDQEVKAVYNRDVNHRKGTDVKPKEAAAAA
ncbi:MAG: hypothetical protein Q9218_006469 [Villophora microphyllina]